MEYKDYYRILGVERNAPPEEIRRAYRRLARQYHPDVNPGDSSTQERFKEINEAYEVLSDPEKRAKYDRLGADWEQWQRAGGPGGFDWSQWMAGQPGGARVWTQYGDLGDLFEEGSFSDFFRQVFGGTGGDWAGTRSRPRKGQDLEHEVEVTLEEAAQGTTRLVSVDGRRLEVRIPPGVKTGSRVRMADEGAPGMAGGPKGDLYLRLKVLPHPVFEREGDDLRCELPVNLYDAILGSQVEVTTLAGKVKLRIPPETQNGTVFRLRGQGLPKLSSPGENGDLYVKVKVVLPQKLSPKEQELFRELAGRR